MASPIPLHLLSPTLSYIISMGYFSVMCLLALWMCRRNFTRLRIFACTLTFYGLSIAIMGYLRAVRVASPCWFWVWNFAGELLAVSGLTIAIVSVGNGFYPMSRNRSIYWAMAMGIISLYVTFAIINIGLYIATKMVYHHISYDEVMHLRQEIIHVGMATTEEILAERLDECQRGAIDTCDVPLEGYHSWRQLSFLEREMYARPATWAYMAHQILMLVTCLWVVVYLFIPLVRNHRHGAIGRSVDGDSMAVGVWYLSTLVTLATIYGSLNVYYLTYFELIYHGSVQALDLGIRCIIGPIFFIPAPRCLIEFYRRHFSAMAKSGSNAESRRGGLGSGVATTPRFDGQGSFLNPSFDIRPTASFIGSGNDRGGVDADLPQPQQAYFPPQVVRGSFDILYPNGGGDKEEGGGMTTGETTESGPLKRMYGSLKLFHSRNRGLSSESGRQFNQDYPCELEIHDRSSTPSPLPRDHGRSNKERRPSKERPESTQRLTEEGLNDDTTGSGQYYYPPTNYSSHSDVDPLNVAEIQKTSSGQGLRAPPPHDFGHAKYHTHLSPTAAAATADAPQEWRETPRAEDSLKDKRDSNSTGEDGVSPAEWRHQQQRPSLDLLQGNEARGRHMYRTSQDSSRVSYPRRHRRSYTHSQLEEESMRRASGGAMFSDPLQDYAVSALGGEEHDNSHQTGSIIDMSLQQQQQQQKRHSLGRRSSEVTRRSMLMRDDYHYDIAGRDSFIEVPRQAYGGFTSRDRVARMSDDSSWSPTTAAASSGHGYAFHKVGGGGGGSGGTTAADFYLPELQDSLVSHAVDPTYWSRAPADANGAGSGGSGGGGGSGSGGVRWSRANRDSGILSPAPTNHGSSAVDPSATKSGGPKLQHKSSRTLLGIVGGGGGGKKKEAKEKDAKEKEAPAADKKSATKSRWWPAHRREASAGTTGTTFSNDSDVPPTPSTTTAAAASVVPGSGDITGSSTAALSASTLAGTESTMNAKGGYQHRGIEGPPIEELTKASIQCPSMAEEAARRAEESLWAQYDYPDPYYDESTYRKFLKPKDQLEGDSRRGRGAISHPEDVALSSSSSPQALSSSPPMPSDARSSIQLHAAQLETRGIKSSLEMTSSPIVLPSYGVKATDEIGGTNTPSSPSPASARTSFGGFLTRTASGSKRLVPPKLKPRGLRSKTDTNNNNAVSSAAAGIAMTTTSAPGHGGLGSAGTRVSADAKGMKLQTALPITATRPNPPPEEDLSQAYDLRMAATSLSPPPRQTNWQTTRARASSQLTPMAPQAAAALLLAGRENHGHGHGSGLGKGAAKSSTLSVDTVAANAARAGGGEGSGSVASLSPRTATTATSTGLHGSLWNPGVKTRGTEDDCNGENVGIPRCGEENSPAGE
ncbi:hypothetical protein DFQ27_001889 [Actinomortierella ambigua]|uniref:Uncharacterized protein n=1 Tax=Actinomortierella ambigua TaxID=1343610 RepID=A0A9P6QCG9_9FUNG|nr:hypothetical protein DFQ27_001889 [Actinomortierella ambigua]